MTDLTPPDHYQSLFAKRFTQTAGITALMEDLSEANNSTDTDVCMLGGGNPAIISEVTQCLSDELAQTKNHHALIQQLSQYSSPQGDNTFIRALVDYLNDHYNWNLTPENIALTNGSQTSFFYLFNLFAGKMSNGSVKKILFPIAPEYIGYRDIGLSEEILTANQPEITLLENNLFKYTIDFSSLKIEPDVAALCISRPTNPTGNVIDDNEVQQLDALAKQHNIPLIIDSAYGLPFPGTIYEKTRTHWNENIIMTLSLSKLGLPGVRTGIIIAKPAIISAITKLNGTLCLAPNNIGAGLTTRIINNRKIDSLITQTIVPFYRKKMCNALSLTRNILQDHNVRIHKPEGAFFLWLWFPDLAISTQQLYQRLKAKKVYIIPGEDFFMGVKPEWRHQYECIRINYAGDSEQLERGVRIIAETLQEIDAESTESY